MSPSRVARGLHAGEVGPRDRLGEELTPQLVTGEDAREVAALEVVADAWASITCAHTPNVVPPAMPKLGST